MAKTIDTLIKALPEKHNMNISKDDNGVSINVVVPGETSEDAPVTGVTVRVDGDRKIAEKALLVIAEIVKEY